MNKNKSTEIKDDNRQKSKKKIPGYLKYVAKKSKAGFGKVHEELYRMFSESRTPADKFTGQVKPTDHSFISYITEEKEDLGSRTSTEIEFDMLSSELNVIKPENNAFHNGGICFASVYNKNKNKFNVNNIRLSMPYLELTDEAIYVNDRVLLVENLTSLSKKEEESEDPSVIYSVPKPKYKPHNSYEIDDYVNLRAPCQLLEDTSDAEKAKEVKSTKNIKPFITPEPCDKTAVNISPCKIIKRPPLSQLKNETLGSHNDDDDYYLLPSRWTQSCYMPATNSYLYATVAQKQTSNCDKPTTIVTNNNVCNSNVVRTELKEENCTETDDSYVPPSKWVGCSYETVTEDN
ncbi:uncharacterized protein LOC123564256 isoform X2 [Mercenaria mercenaria]|uniref:uncharacterized protein LOC123564256 isoform X2 n=1 Tax=Mercenaria mercenaria TaxID=6596 RepID=UPI00234F3619|nr:uncharacterized protein LOC123564256 isoform X2 [Mercenaria mercenaria]